MEQDAPPNFIRAIIDEHLAEGRYDQIVTRFPPEPNGYLHIGHAKAICVDFGTAARYGGRCHLRFDDTNPVAEDVAFTEGIKEDIRWLGFDWGEHLYHASDYFPKLYAWAERLIREGKAYVDSLSEAEIRDHRGTVTEPGRPSPYRERPVEESLRLLDEMKRGLHPEGAHVVRAKADMAHPNMKMRDPLMYRILRRPHDRTGAEWNIYPMYDYAHGLSDAIEGVTHSICTLEFDNNRALYDLFLDLVGFEEPRPHQYEMARLNLPYTMMSKRKLRALVEEGIVEGWDDPRMPTLRALRRRGVPPAAVRAFVERVGVSKATSVIDPVLLDNAIRDALNPVSERYMAVLDPLPLTLTNWPASKVDRLDASLFPHDVPRTGSRQVPFGRTVLVERTDFAERPPKGWKRLAVGAEIRLRYAYLVTITDVERDDQGEVVGLLGTVDRDSRGGKPADGRKVRGTVHWVSAEHAVPVETRLYERLFNVEAPDAEEDYRAALNPDSKQVRSAWVEPALANTLVAARRNVDPELRVQLERLGYFWLDPAARPELDAGAWEGPPGTRGPSARDRHGLMGEAVPVLVRVVPLKEGYRLDAELPAPPPAPSAPAGVGGGERVHNAAERAAIAAWAERGVGEEEALVLHSRPELRALYEGAGEGPELARFVVHEVPRALGERALEDSALRPEALGALVARVKAGQLTHKIARDVLAVLVEAGGEPDAVVAARGWAPVADEGALAAAVDAVLAENPAEREAWLGGKDRLVGFFVGQVMKKTGGRADARRVQELLAERRGG